MLAGDQWMESCMEQLKQAKRDGILVGTLRAASEEEGLSQQDAEDVIATALKGFVSTSRSHLAYFAGRLHPLEKV